MKRFQGKTRRRLELEAGNENGLILSGQYLPEELLLHILYNLDTETLLTCHLVCKRWKILADRYVWRKKAETSLGRQLAWNDAIPWTLYHSICTKRPFERNLVKNHSGELGVTTGWQTIHEAGDKWAVENPPQGMPPLPDNPALEGKQFCFVTSYGFCSKKQVVDLEQEGLSRYVLDELQPPIVVEEYYGCRWDCPARYQCFFRLLDVDDTVVGQLRFKDDIKGDRQNKWQHVQHEFRDYGPGLKVLEFFHGGMDSAYWAGHYGTKMAGASVVVRVPSILWEARAEPYDAY